MAKAAAISFREFRMRYHTEAACREELFRQRFPEGFVCPKKEWTRPQTCDRMKQRR